MSFAAALSRATKRVLDRSGEDALLRGVATIHKVHVARDIEMVDRQGNLVVVAYVATISSADDARSDDALVISTGPNVGSYVIETKIDDNGFFARYIVRKV